MQGIIGTPVAEFEMKKTITFLECRIMESLRTIETMNIYMKSHKEGVEVDGSSSLARDREAKVKTLMRIVALQKSKMCSRT